MDIHETILKDNTQLIQPDEEQAIMDQYQTGMEMTSMQLKQMSHIQKDYKDTRLVQLNILEEGMTDGDPGILTKLVEQASVQALAACGGLTSILLAPEYPRPVFILNPLIPRGIY